MSKKLISALLVLFMVLNLIAGFPVMAEETAGGTAEAISENKSAVETNAGNTSAVKIDGDTASTADAEPAKAEAEDTPSDSVQAAPGAAKKAADEKSKPAESSKTAAEPALVGAGEESTIPEADTHTVTFDMRGHYTEVASQKVADGEKAVKPASPVNYDKASDYDTTGLRFRMWHEDLPEDLTYETLWNNAYGFREPITEDKTLYAIYETVLSLQAYDITNDVWSVGGTITWDHIYHGSPQTRSNAQTTVIEGTRETLTANPNPGYKFVGWSSSKSKDDIECTDPVYSFINEHRKTIYALFEEEAPKQELSFRIRRTPGSPVPLTELVSSVTVNGEEWQLPSGEMTVEGKIEAGASVSAVIKATDDYIFHSVTEPGGGQTGDFTSDLSQDGSTLTVSFTMPEDPAEIGIELTRALTILYDVNGGTK